MTVASRGPPRRHRREQARQVGLRATGNAPPARRHDPTGPTRDSSRYQLAYLRPGVVRILGRLPLVATWRTHEDTKEGSRSCTRSDSLPEEGTRIS
jgi:hypothetical protein